MIKTIKRLLEIKEKQLKLERKQNAYLFEILLLLRERRKKKR